MTEYVAYKLHRLQYDSPTNTQHIPQIFIEPTYGAKFQISITSDNIPLLDLTSINRIQQLL